MEAGPEMAIFPGAGERILPHRSSSGGCPEHLLPSTALPGRRVYLMQSFPQAA